MNYSFPQALHCGTLGMRATSLAPSTSRQTTQSFCTTSVGPTWTGCTSSPSYSSTGPTGGPEGCSLLDNRLYSLYSDHLFGRRNATAVFQDLYSALFRVFTHRQPRPACKIHASQDGVGQCETTHIFSRCFPLHSPSDSAVQSLQRTLQGMDLPAEVLVDYAEP